MKKIVLVVMFVVIAFSNIGCRVITYKVTARNLGEYLDLGFAKESPIKKKRIQYDDNNKTIIVQIMAVVLDQNIPVSADGDVNHYTTWLLSDERMGSIIENGKNQAIVVLSGRKGSFNIYAIYNNKVRGRFGIMVE